MACDEHVREPVSVWLRPSRGGARAGSGMGSGAESGAVAPQAKGGAREHAAQTYGFRTHGSRARGKSQVTVRAKAAQ
eukprot:3517309-Prymnesium_polylepis.1